MTFALVLQLYAPFVGLMALAFWMGVLSQRVRQLEKDCDRGSLLERVTRLEVKMDGADKKLDHIDTNMQGINRQLANIAMNKVGEAVALPGSK